MQRLFSAFEVTHTASTYRSDSPTLPALAAIPCILPYSVRHVYPSVVRRLVVLLDKWLARVVLAWHGEFPQRFALSALHAASAAEQDISPKSAYTNRYSCTREYELYIPFAWQVRRRTEPLR